MKKTLYMILFTTLCLGFSACSPTDILKDEVASRREDRIYCKLNENDATKFTYGDTEYVILEENNYIKGLVPTISDHPTSLFRDFRSYSHLISTIWY